MFFPNGLWVISSFLQLVVYLIGCKVLFFSVLLEQTAYQCCLSSGWCTDDLPVSLLTYLQKHFVFIWNASYQRCDKFCYLLFCMLAWVFLWLAPLIGLLLHILVFMTAPCLPVCVSVFLAIQQEMPALAMFTISFTILAQSPWIGHSFLAPCCMHWKGSGC